MSKANKDGWIMHRGSNCPVDGSDRIDVRYRGGYVSTWREADDVNWEHQDLMAWRPHKAEQQIVPAVVANVDAFNAQAEMPAAKQEGPLQWRDRAQEINRQMADLRAEKAGLIIKLSDEGFTLIGEQPL